MIERGTKVGRYEIRSKIDEGGMGEVKSIIVAGTNLGDQSFAYIAKGLQ